MKFRSLLSLFFLLLPGLALAAGPYHVRPGGNNNNSGTSWQNAWQTIQKANTELRPGEKCYVYEGIYSASPNPDSGGSNPSGRIDFIGASLNGDPITDTTIRKSIIVPNVNLSKGYISIRGMFVGGSINISADRDSVDNCHSNSSFGIQSCKYSYITNSYIYGTTPSSVGVDSYADPTVYWASGSDTIYSWSTTVGAGNFFSAAVVGDRVKSGNAGFPKYAVITEKVDANTIIISDVTSSTAVGGTDRVRLSKATVQCGIMNCSIPKIGIGYTGIAPGLFYTRNVDSLKVWRNQWGLYIDPSSSDAAPTHGRMFYGMCFSSFKDNRLIAENARPSYSSRYIGNFRDLSNADTVQADTVIALGPGGWRWSLGSSGNFGGYYRGMDGIFIDSLFYYNNTHDEVMYATADRVNNITIQNSVIVATNEHVLTTGDIKGKNKLIHNTFVGDPYEGIVKITRESSYPMFTDTLFIKDNIFHSVRNNPVPDYLPYPYGDSCGYSCRGSADFAITVSPGAFDSLSSCESGALGCTYPRLQSNNNLYSFNTYRIIPGDRSIGFFQDTWNSSAPGDSSLKRRYLSGGDFYWRDWEGKYSKDSLSIANDPGFRNTSLAINTGKRTYTDFDPSLVPNSPAIQAASDGTDIGAIQSISEPVLSYYPTIVVLDSTYNNSRTTPFTIVNAGVDTLAGIAHGYTITKDGVSNAIVAGLSTFSLLQDATKIVTVKLKGHVTGYTGSTITIYDNANDITTTSDVVIQPNGTVLIGYIYINHNDPKSGVPNPIDNPLENPSWDTFVPVYYYPN